MFNGQDLENYEFHFEFVKFDMPVNYLGRKIKQAVGNMYLNFEREIETRKYYSKISASV